MKFIKHSISLLLLAALASADVLADPVVIPNTFRAGTAAIADDVNENFTALAKSANEKDTKLNDLESTLSTLTALVQTQGELINELKATIESQQGKINALESDLALQSRDLSVIEKNPVLDLGSYILVSKDERGPLVRLSGVNVQIVNGDEKEETGSINGLGNLIIGYDEANPANTLAFQHCSIGQFDNQDSCIAGDGVWSNSLKSGSHNLVLGSENSYSSFGGLVGGHRNFITGDYASVLSGYGNVAGGESSGVLGGTINDAHGVQSVIAGGSHNKVDQLNSSIGGGASVLLDTRFDFASWAAGSLIEEPEL